MYFLLVSIVVEGVSSTGLVLPHSSEQIILKDFTFWSSSTIHDSCHCNQEVLITGRCTSPPYLIVVVRVDSGGGICLICSDKERKGRDRKQERRKEKEGAGEGGRSRERN